jgi:hypothetical protein
MADQEAVNTDAFGRRQGPPRKEVVGASVSADEKAEIVARFAADGYGSASEGARVVLLAYLASEQIRSAVDSFRRELAA